MNEAQELKQLRKENTRLKKLVADLRLDKDMPHSVIRKLPEFAVRRAECSGWEWNFKAGSAYLRAHEYSAIELPLYACAADVLSLTL